MWLPVGNSNNDPRIIAKHYIDCVRLVGGEQLFIIMYLQSS